MKINNKKCNLVIIISLMSIIFVAGYFFIDIRLNFNGEGQSSENLPENQYAKEDNLDELTVKIKEKKASIVAEYSDRIPEEWGEDVSGVITRINTKEKVIALTLDACGGDGFSDGYDEQLINFLRKKSIPATLFINYQWIEVNPEIFRELAADSLFSIQNHGYHHLPLSVKGRDVHDTRGTQNPGEVVEEVLYNQLKIEKLTGRKSRFFRSGTAYYDEVAVEIVNELGEEVIGFDILGDAGATFSAEQVKEAFLSAEPGSIILAHMNRPESETAAGIMEAIPELKEKGYRFVKLQEVEEKLTME